MALNFSPTSVVSATVISSTTENTNLAGLAAATSDGLWCNDSTTGTTHHVALYPGTVDPATRGGVTVNEGDFWAQA